MKSNLVLMDAGMFCEGMQVKAKIYYLYRGTYVLLCKDTVFTSELTEKLYRIAEEYGGVYIEEKHYEEVWNESLHRYALDADAYTKSYQKVQKEYNEVLSKTTSFLGEISSEGIVSMETSNEIAESIAGNIEHSDQSLVLRCVNQINEVDNYLYTHCVNVASLNGLLGQWMNLPEEDVKKLIKIGLLHDLGKLRVPPEVLNKPGRLDNEEFQQIKRHPIYSYEMLRESGEQDEAVLHGVLEHHERPNGTGYPNGLSQAQISLFARITAVSDVYDAMVSKRCYKEACVPFQILDQFKENRFSDLDLQVINVFLEHITYLFVGMKVRLSNGECGEIIFIPPADLANPVVKVGQHVFSTNDDCKCVSVEFMD